MRVFIMFRRSFRSLNLCAFRIRNRNRQFPLVRAIRRFRKNRIKSIKIGAKIQNISRYDLVFYSYAFFFFFVNNEFVNRNEVDIATVLDKIGILLIISLPTIIN